MNRLAFCLALAGASLVSTPPASAQYCPQVCEGQMGGTYYFYCQNCCDTCTCTSWTVVAVNSYYNPGGGCPGCGGCTDEIPAGARGKEEKKDAEEEKEDAPCRGTVTVGVNRAPMAGAQPPSVKSKGVTMQDDLIGTGAGAGNADNLSAQDVYILWITDNKNNAHYFRCVTVTDRSNANAPFTFRIAHELKAPPADMSNTFQGMRCSGKNWSHRIRLNANSPVFDALSMVDLDNQ